MAFMGNLLMENRNGLVVGGQIRLTIQPDEPHGGHCVSDKLKAIHHKG
jgi:hypothetical protein